MNAPLSPSEIAREALRQLAAQRIAPTPENYTKLFRSISGSESEPDEVEIRKRLSGLWPVLADRHRQGPQREQIEQALALRDWKAACSALSALAESLGGDSAAKSRQESAGPASGWVQTIGQLIKALDSRHAGWTRVKKTKALDLLLSAPTSGASGTLERLQDLIQSWNKSAPAQTSLDSGDGPAIPETDRQELTQSLRDCLVVALEAPLARLLHQAPDLAWEARMLASRARQAASPAMLGTLAADLRAFANRIDLHGGGDAALRDALLRLLRLLVDNIEELVAGDHWLQGQVAIVRNVLGRPLTPEVIEEAERAIKDLMAKQKALRQSLNEAKASLKALLQDFIEKLGEMAADTSEYHEKLGLHAQKLQQTNDIADLNALILDLMSDTRAMQISTRKSSEALLAARTHAEAAELRILEMERELVQLSERAREDQLTGTLNRRGLDEAFRREASRSDRLQTPMCVALLDIDNFKQLNDSLGHQAGDDALLHIVRVIKDHLRPADVLARYGGEEFVILLPESDVREAVEVMTRLQRELTKRFFLHNNERLLITFSCGVALRGAGEEMETAVSRADKALYNAKRAGKNRVMTEE